MFQTGVTTVQKVPKVIGKKGLHQIGQVTSRERGELVTNVGIIGASGRALPLIWVFPRLRFDEKRMMRGVPPNTSLGLVHKSGWMTSSNFIEVLRFFVNHVCCTKETPVLLILDNHESHLSVDGLEFCKENGIVLLTLPPHTSNKLQPLDRSVFGPFKTFVSQAMNAWLMDHPGETLTIYDLPELCTTAWDRAAMPVNIKSGFKCTGIEPFDRCIFSDEDFLQNYVTDKPLPSSSSSTADRSTPIPSTSASSDLIATLQEKTPPPSAASQSSGTESQLKTTKFTTPEEIQPFRKVVSKSMKGGSRRRGKTMIATDTPEKLEIEERQRKRKNHNEQSGCSQSKKSTARKRIIVDSSEDEENVPYAEESHDWVEDSSDTDGEEIHELADDEKNSYW